MRYVAAYLLAALGSAASPSAKDIKAILSSVGIEADDERLNKVGLRPRLNVWGCNDMSGVWLTKPTSDCPGGE